MMNILLLHWVIFIIPYAKSDLVSLTNRVCITNGVISHGLFVNPNITSYSSKPLNGLCPNGSILIQPGVMVYIGFNPARIQPVDSNGLCVTRGILRTGIAATIGAPTQIGQNISALGVQCSFVDELSLPPDNYVILSIAFNVYLEVLAENIPNINELFSLQDSPLLVGLTYTLKALNESVCVESGFLLDVFSLNDFQDNITVFEQLNGVCSNGTLLLGYGSFDLLSQTIFSNSQCLGNSVIAGGRVLVTGSSTPIGKTIKSGFYSGLNCSGMLLEYLVD